jgi:hypothetical protein
MKKIILTPVGGPVCMESSHKGFTDVDYILRHKRILFNTFSENL